MNNSIVEEFKIKKIFEKQFECHKHNKKSQT